jgi:mannonate dehydratase
LVNKRCQAWAGCAEEARPLNGDGVDKPTKPGYSLIGRLKGLAELHGVIHAIGKIGAFSRYWKSF